MKWIAFLENLAALGAGIQKLAQAVRQWIFNRKIDEAAKQAQDTRDTSALENAFDDRPR